MSRDAASLSGHWQRRIFRLACRLNFGWWLDSFLLFFFVLSLLCMCALLLARRHEWSEPAVWNFFLIALVPVALAAFFKARRHFENKNSARVRLEYALGLHNRLTAAAAGVGTWPAVNDEIPPILRWRWRPFLSLGLASLFLLLAGAFVPIPKDRGRSAFQGAKPPALEMMESWLDVLEQNQLIEEKPLEEVKKEVEQLSDRPPDEWYSQANLEASDHLREQLQTQLKSLQQDLQSAASSLEKMQEQGTMTESQMAQLSGKLAEALDNAQAGQLPLSSKFMENLPEIDPSKLKSLSAEQAKAMMEKLKEAQAGIGQAGGDGEDPVAALAMAEVKMGVPGGGVDRGPGTVPLTLNPNPSDAGSTKIEGMSNDDHSRASLGETIGVSKGAHDKTPMQYETTGGGSAVQGSGGEAVWVNQLTPEEQAQVKSFFK